MSAELDLSPPEVPEPTFLESLLRYGLFLGAIFQLICILAVIVPTSKGHEQVGRHQGKERSGSCVLSPPLLKYSVSYSVALYSWGLLVGFQQCRHC